MRETPQHSDDEILTHTPGPWESHSLSLSDNTLVVTGRHGEGYEKICTVRERRDYSDDDYRAQANARLIAAAPDLLEVCLDALRTLNCNSTRVMDGSDLNRITRILGDAIAKAAPQETADP